MSRSRPRPMSPTRRRIVTLLATVPVAGLLSGFRRLRHPALLDPQPHMKAALADLESARQHLAQATADKGGHRAAALELVDKAINQVKEGIKFDNRT